MDFKMEMVAEAKNDIQIILNHAFPESLDLSLILAVALKNAEERKLTHREDPQPLWQKTSTKRMQKL